MATGPEFDLEDEPAFGEAVRRLIDRGLTST